jgi:hypothetical protein
MVFDRSALTTIPCRSFSGPGLARFASTLLVCACAGVVLLLPEPVSSTHDLSSQARTSVCAESHDPVQDHQWTDDTGINAPDSCDDDDEDDEDGDDDSPGSGHAIADGQRGPAHLDHALHLVHIDVDPRVFRPLDAHSLRGPPAVHQESSDADLGDDDDDDSLGAHDSVPLAAASSRQPHSPVSIDSLRKTSIRSGQALRAPPQ